MKLKALCTSWSKCTSRRFFLFKQEDLLIATNKLNDFFNK